MTSSDSFPLALPGGTSPPVAVTRQIQQVYRQLAESQAQMTAARTAFVQAMEDTSGLFRYCYFSTVMSLATAGQMNLFAQATGIITPDIADEFGQLGRVYVGSMREAFQSGAANVLQHAQEAAAFQPEEPSFLARLFLGE